MYFFILELKLKCFLFYSELIRDRKNSSDNPCLFQYSDVNVRSCLTRIFQSDLLDWQHRIKTSTLIVSWHVPLLLELLPSLRSIHSKRLSWCNQSYTADYRDVSVTSRVLLLIFWSLGWRGSLLLKMWKHGLSCKSVHAGVTMLVHASKRLCNSRDATQGYITAILLWKNKKCVPSNRKDFV